jgi:hypothetical protein
MMQKFKLNTHASISKQHIFLRDVLFDHRGVHLLRRAKVIRIENDTIVKAEEENKNPKILEAEARVLISFI